MKILTAICGHVEIGGKFFEAVKVEYQDGKVEVRHIDPDSNYSSISPCGKYKFFQQGELKEYRCEHNVLCCFVPTKIMERIEN